MLKCLCVRVFILQTSHSKIIQNLQLYRLSLNKWNWNHNEYFSFLIVKVIVFDPKYHPSFIREIFFVSIFSIIAQTICECPENSCAIKGKCDLYFDNFITVWFNWSPFNNILQKFIDCPLLTEWIIIFEKHRHHEHLLCVIATVGWRSDSHAFWTPSTLP